MSRFQNISDEEFTTIVKQNDCIRDIVGALGYSRSSGSMGVKVSERINALNIDISHFAKKIRCIFTSIIFIRRNSC